MRLIVSMGRGGSGKTSFVALLSKRFIELGKTPILLVDADPDQNLAEVVGIDLEKEGKKTISEIVTETFLEEKGTLVGVPPSERVEGKIWEEGLYEGKQFDLIAIGPKWVEGCYCLPNAALKNALERLVKNYENVIVDSPAGLEHLNRRITSNVDDIFDIIDPSQKSFEHIVRAVKIIEEVRVSFKNFYVVGGYRFPESLKPSIEKRTNAEFLGKIAYDKNVEEFIMSRKSLLELPSSSPAYCSINEIMKKAGYI
ncbi:MAG: AAA family ATPase [Candidatus Bathyarchaeia archaeon]|nr:AAA family ATPase [Candidatus Bathyarchaeota archaeon]